MKDHKSFREIGHQLIDWMADYLEQGSGNPVKSQVQPGDVFRQLPDQAPEQGEDSVLILNDFEKIILPGMTHWQDPRFFAYFPANSSYPSLLAEMLTAAIGAQCMSWETSPAATELEEQMMNWLGQLIGIPENWDGVIQPTASDATLCAILTAREKFSRFQINEKGFSGLEKFRVYSSTQTHSSIGKALKIAGIGEGNYVKIAVDENFAMRKDGLLKAIDADLKAGLKPLCVVATIGTTSSTAIDPLKDIANICERYQLWLHVDAAYAGSALILPEYQHWMNGIEKADSFVFNPHKWMLTNFDCSAYFVKDKELLIRTFGMTPEYLRTKKDHEVNNYRDWGIPLGRRFRALKLWFVMRSYGVAGIQDYLRNHMDLAHWLEKEIMEARDFETLAPVNLNLVCFRYKPEGVGEHDLNRLNERLLHELNSSGQLYLTHTKLEGRFSLRMAIGSTRVEKKHVEEAWKQIQETAGNLER